jgi:hypothetical protein
MEALTMFVAALRSRWPPTAVEPVKLILRRRASPMTVSETAAEFVVCRRLTTPGGKPASCRTWTNRAPVSGVSWAVFMTTVQPAARAAPALRADMSSGKFHGVISRHGPTG